MIFKGYASPCDVMSSVVASFAVEYDEGAVIIHSTHFDFSKLLRHLVFRFGAPLFDGLDDGIVAVFPLVARNVPRPYRIGMQALFALPETFLRAPLILSSRSSSPPVSPQCSGSAQTCSGAAPPSTPSPLL